jgi:hypothetical protein
LSLELRECERRKYVESDGQSFGSDAVANQDATAIQKMIERFAEVIRTLDADLVSSVFHPQASSFSLTSRGICIEPAKAWPEIIRKANADSAHLFRERFSVRTVNIDVDGSVASAKVEWKFESARIVDFYNLLKTDRGWLIINQVYHTYTPSKTG